MHIRDIAITDILSGKNWKVVNADEFDWLNDTLDNLAIESASDFQPDDLIVYSAVSVTKTGDVTPLVLIKEVGDLDYGGDYCEFLDGRWRQLGLTPCPDAPSSEEFVANPLPQDASFISDNLDYRGYHSDGFARFSPKLLVST